ncbi:MAG: 50S ribosomal protein L19 [Candidatus Pacebacteria bacterium]|nr:50S ribosomal protein L19 [Candidatus Paceibacterota bacterium]
MALILTPVNKEERAGLDFASGDTVRVWVKIPEKGKFRLQAFEGLVLARKHGKEIGGTFTVRKVASGVGVERIFPLYSPMIDSIEIIKRSGARRSKLYYVREKAVRDIRKKMKSVRVFENNLADATEEVATETEEKTEA